MNIKKIVLALACIAAVGVGIGLSIMAHDGSFSHNNGVTVNSDTAGVTFNNNSNNTNSQSYDINDKKSAKLEGINDIEVTMPVGAVNFISENRQDIEADLHGSVTAGKGYIPPELTIDANGNKVAIAVKNQSNGINVSNNNITLDIRIPASYSQNVSVNTQVGNLSIGSLNLKKLKCTAGTGSIQLKDLKLSDLSLTCTTGDIKGSNIKSKNTDFNVTTGSVKIDGIESNIVGKMTTGNADISYTSFNNSIDISSTIGSIKLQLPKESEFYLKAKSSLGKISCDFPVSGSISKDKRDIEGTVKSNKNQIKLSISTGDIKVY